MHTLHGTYYAGNLLGKTQDTPTASYVRAPLCTCHMRRDEHYDVCAELSSPYPPSYGDLPPSHIVMLAAFQESDHLHVDMSPITHPDLPSCRVADNIYPSKGPILATPSECTQPPLPRALAASPVPPS